MCGELFHALAALLKKGLATSVGIEVVLHPDLGSDEEAISTSFRLIEKAGYEPGRVLYLPWMLHPVSGKETKREVCSSKCGKKFTSAGLAVTGKI